MTTHSKGNRAAATSRPRIRTLEEAFMISDELLGRLGQVAQSLALARTLRVPTKRKRRKPIEAIVLTNMTRELAMELGLALWSITWGHSAKIVFRQHRKRSLLAEHMRAALLYWLRRTKDPARPDALAIQAVRDAIEKLRARSPIYIRKIAQTHQVYALDWLDRADVDTRLLRKYLHDKYNPRRG